MEVCRKKPQGRMVVIQRSKNLGEGDFSKKDRQVSDMTFKVCSSQKKKKYVYIYIYVHIIYTYPFGREVCRTLLLGISFENGFELDGTFQGHTPTIFVHGGPHLAGGRNIYKSVQKCPDKLTPKQP